MALTPTITAQRACENTQGLVVRRRNEWGARRAYTDDNPVTHPASFMFLHISITNPSAYSTEDRHAQAIENIGISRFPNTGISYNMMVMPSGRIFEGQPVGRRGAHTVNTFNRRTCSTSGCPSRTTSLSSQNNLNFNARAVVLAQNTDDPVTSIQIHSVAKVFAAWKRCGYVSRGARLHGHRCVTAKSCPGNIAWTHMGTINKLIEQYTVNGLKPPPTGDDLVTTQAQFDGFMNAWMNQCFVQTAAYNQKVSHALVAGQPLPVVPVPGYVRSGIAMQVYSWWQTLGRHDPANPDPSKRVAPNMHGVMGAMLALAKAFEEGGELNLQLDQILAESIEDDPTVPPGEGDPNP